MYLLLLLTSGTILFNIISISSLKIQYNNFILKKNVLYKIVESVGVKYLIYYWSKGKIKFVHY